MEAHLSAQRGAVSAQSHNCRRQFLTGAAATAHSGLPLSSSSLAQRGSRQADAESKHAHSHV